MKISSSTRRPLLAIGLPLIATLALTACGEQAANRGPVVTETREVGAFDAIALRGNVRLEVQVGGQESITLEGNEQALERISTDVQGDTLRIRTNRKDWALTDGSHRSIVRITMPKLVSLKVEGGNDVWLAGFDGGEATVDVEGAASLEANGRLDRLVVHMAGAGQADLRQLVVSAAKVTVDGVGRVYVHSTDSLDATMNGVGAILYSGSPRHVSTSMNGIGTIGKESERSPEHANEKGQGRTPNDQDALRPEHDDERTEKI